MFGNSFPDNAAPSLEQAFSLLIAALGIASFAISLALVEQVVLENLDANVRRGSKVYENEHVCVSFSHSFLGGAYHTHRDDVGVIKNNTRVSVDKCVLINGSPRAISGGMLALGTL